MIHFIYIMVIGLLLLFINDTPAKDSFSEIKNSKYSYITDRADCNLSLNTSVEQDLNNKDKLIVTNGIQENPLNIKISDLDQDEPILKSNMGSTKLMKITDGDRIYLVEKTGLDNIVMYTLFVDKGILIMSKQYDSLGTAFGMQMIGFCKSY